MAVNECAEERDAPAAAPGASPAPRDARAAVQHLVERLHCAAQGHPHDGVCDDWQVRLGRQDRPDGEAVHGADRAQEREGGEPLARPTVVGGPLAFQAGVGDDNELHGLWPPRDDGAIACVAEGEGPN